MGSSLDEGCLSQGLLMVLVPCLHCRLTKVFCPFLLPPCEPGSVAPLA